MWYKTAKYGTLWDRLGPESEQEIDRILDESTIVEKVVDPKTKTEKQVKKIDYKKLDQLLKKSLLGEKGVLNKIIEFHDPMYGNYGGVWLSDKGSVPLIQTKISVPLIQNKILNIPILIRNYMDKVIHINPNVNKSYFLTRGVIKHEISHAISSAVLPQSRWRETENPDSPEQEFYLQHGRLRKEDIRDNYKATGTFLSFDKIRKAIFYDKLPAFEKFLSEKLGPDFIKEYLIESLDESTLPQRAEKIFNLFTEFNWERNVAGLYQKRIYEVSKDELREIEKIEDDPYNDIAQATYVSPDTDKFWDKHNAELEKRSKLLGPGVDLYYANPEETRSHLAENKEYFSLSAVKEYYALQNYTTPEEQHIPEFLNLIKTIFNEAVIYGESGNFYHINNYFDTLNLGDFLHSDLYYKRYDLKFQRQLAKILNENYQQIKQYFNDLLTKKEGE